jgi:UDP-N-acetylglucosamine 2-epimerase
MKVVTIVGTRPEIIKLSRIINKLDKNLDHVLIHTGQNFDFELNEVFFNEMEIRKPDIFLNANGATSIETIGKILIKVDSVISEIKPDAILILGDTNSGLSALSAKKHKIPIFHLEAGNRCFDQRVPEEINRKIIDNLADINLTYSNIAREYLLSEGFDPDRVIKVGSPMFEVLKYYEDQIESSNILQRFELKKGQYFLVSVHREENVDSSRQFEKFIGLLNKISEIYELPIIVSTHPRTRNKLNESRAEFSSFVKFLKPLGFFDYVKLQKNARTVLSDSGTITEESSILNFPAINLRETHERPEGMEEAAVIMTSMDIDQVIDGIEYFSAATDLRPLTRIVQDYSISNVSEKVLRIILSYTGYVNRTVWKQFV